jgi:hypothetical protein
MGFAISWLAVIGKSPEAITQELGLKPTGEMGEYGESFFSGRTLSSGWFLLFINQWEHNFIRPKSLASISSNCEVVACSIEEHVMVCTSELWRNGAQIWRLEHDAQKSKEYISKSGVLPTGYSAIEREFSEQQKHAGGETADTDYFFEIPLQTAKSIVGFKHDETGAENDGFVVFKSATLSPPVGPSAARDKRPWWKLW